MSRLRSCIRGWNTDELGGLTGGSLWRSGVGCSARDGAGETLQGNQLEHEHCAHTQGLYQKPQAVDIMWK